MMKKLKSNLAAKIIAMVLVIVSLAVFGLSAAGIVLMDSCGIYREKEADILKQAYEQACLNYSITALAGYEDNFNRKELEQTNFRYGIVKTDDNIYKMDLSNRNNYLACYMDEIPDEDQLYIYGSNVAAAWFSCGSNLWDQFYEAPDIDYAYKTVEYLIEGYYYNISDDNIYVKYNNKSFLVYEASWPYWVYSDKGDEVWQLDASLIKAVLDEHANTKNIWDETYNDTTVELAENLSVPLRDIHIVDNDEIEKMGGVSDAEIDYIDDGVISVFEKEKKKAEYYYIVSCIQPDLTQWKGGIFDADMFQQANMIVGFLYRIRYAVIGILIFSLLVFAASFVFLMCAAGHQKGYEEIRPRFLDRVPLDLYFSCVCVVDACLAAAAAWCTVTIISWNPRYVSTVRYLFGGLAAAGAGALAILLAVLYCMSFAVNVKLGKWQRRTFIYWCAKKCIKMVRFMVHGCIYVVGGLLKSMTLLWKAWLFLGGIALVEFFTIMLVNYFGELLFLWFIEKMVLYPVIIVLLLQMHKLQKGAQRIAAGDLGYHIDTNHMIWEMKKHGGYLNDIGIGMNRAVNERMKSEHFKTELITNVSHDIKTPLTSIINYVDLLQKEEIENPKVQDYLEVLHRQSARLKKLIEDLMEASKASTGNLTMVMEQCDAGVMLVQTVGEFEEKLMENQIELQVRKPQESIFINADSRHLWRVFDNMMNNICKYAQPTTRAYVDLEQDGQQARVIFRNISKYQLNISSEELMERFVRGDSSRNTEGSGLGISIAKSLTELMGGTFELIVDGDLFKVILSFPLYGTHAVWQSSTDSQGSQNGQEWQQGQVQGAQEPGSGPQTGRFVSGMQNAGAHVKGMGQEAAKKTGRMVRWAGRLAHNVGQAVKQTKMEESKDDAPVESGQSGEASDSMYTRGR